MRCRSSPHHAEHQFSQSQCLEEVRPRALWGHEPRHRQEWDLSELLLRNLYDSIWNEPFSIPDDDGNGLTHTFFNLDQKGQLLKLGGVRWRRRVGAGLSPQLPLLFWEYDRQGAGRNHPCGESEHSRSVQASETKLLWVLHLQQHGAAHWILQNGGRWQGGYTWSWPPRRQRRTSGSSPSRQLGAQTPFCEMLVARKKLILSRRRRSSPDPLPPTPLLTTQLPLPGSWTPGPRFWFPI